MSAINVNKKTQELELYSEDISIEGNLCCISKHAEQFSGDEACVYTKIRPGFRSNIPTPMTISRKHDSKVVLLDPAGDKICLADAA